MLNQGRVGSRVVSTALAMAFSVALGSPARAQVTLGTTAAGFGATVAVGESAAQPNTYIVVGAPAAGRAFAYERAPGSAAFSSVELDGGQTPSFGSAVAAAGSILFVGAPQAKTVFVFTKSGSSWVSSQISDAEETAFGQSIDWNIEANLLVVCGATKCQFYAPIAWNNGVPTWATPAGPNWTFRSGARARFLWNGEFADLVVGTEPGVPGTLTFYSYSTGGYAQTPGPTFSGTFGGIAARSERGSLTARALVIGSGPGRVSTFMQGLTPSYTKYNEFLLPSAGQTVRLSAGISVLGYTALIADVTNGSSQVRRYQLNQGNTPASDAWALDTTQSFGVGGPNYGTALAYGKGAIAIGDPDNSRVLAFDNSDAVVQKRYCEDPPTCAGIEVLINQLGNAGTTSLTPGNCSTFRNQDGSYLSPSTDSKCVKVDTSATLVGLQKVCFPVSQPTSSLGRCYRAAGCQAGETHDPIDGTCCRLLFPDTAVPGKLCGLTDHFSDFAYASFVDGDGDGTPDMVDNCPKVANFSQSDVDGDGIGSSCDNCLTVVNPDQLDYDRDGIGNACDATPGAPPRGVPAPSAPATYLLLLGGLLALLGASRGRAGGAAA